MSYETVDQWLNTVPASQKTILQTLRHMILASGDNVTEQIKCNRPCYSTPSGLFSYLHSARSHATIGFQNGVALSDPDNMLEGDGKDMRHIKFKSTADMDIAALNALIVQAYQNCGK